MAIHTWLPERAVLVQLGLRDCECPDMHQAVVDYAVAIALRHRCSPSTVLAHLALELPTVAEWEPVRDELRRVLHEIGKNHG